MANSSVVRSTNANDLPSGGGAGKIIYKTSTADYAVSWSSIEVDGSGVMTFPEVSTPSAPAAGSQQLYFKTDGNPYFQSSTGEKSFATSEDAGTSGFTQQGSTPSTPSAGDNKLYYKTDGKLYSLDENGSETLVLVEPVATPIFSEEATPTTPATDQYKIYVKSDGGVYIKNDAGTESLVGPTAPVTSLNDEAIVTSGFSGSLNTLTDQQAVNNWVDTNIPSSGVSGGLLFSSFPTGGSTVTTSGFSGKSAVTFEYTGIFTFSATGTLWLRINGQTGNQYAWHYWYDNGGTWTRQTSGGTSSVVELSRGSVASGRMITVRGTIQATSQGCIITSQGGAGFHNGPSVSSAITSGGGFTTINSITFGGGNLNFHGSGGSSIRVWDK
jgi:hypothetical protein